MTQRSITAADLYQFALLGGAQISPDGQRIAYTVTGIDHETYAYHTAIWLTTPTSQPGQERRFVARGGSPRWSPDGQTLAFVSDRAGEMPDPLHGESPADRDKRCGKGKPQIWLIPADGGEAYQLTFMRWGASTPTWSPDSTRLLFVAKTGDIPDMPEHNGEREPRVRRITRFGYRFNGAGYIYELQSHLFVVAATGGQPTQLTDGDWHDGHPTWSPDGQTIAFTTDRHDQRWLYPRGEVWLMDADGTRQRPLLAIDDHDFDAPAWSPDGMTIACLGGPQWGNGGHTDVYVVRPGQDGGATAAPRCLTTDHFQTFSDAIGGDMRNDHADPTPVWSPDGSEIYVIGNARGAGNVYALRVEDGALRAVTSGDHHVIAWSLDAAARNVALVIADVTQPGDLYVHRQEGGATNSGSAASTSRLTAMNAALLDALELATPEEFTFTGAEGWEIEGWILKPPHFDPTKRYPLLLEVHGGPNTAYGYTFAQEFQLLASRGYVVVYTNPRGSTSYGRAFGQAVSGIWGQADYEDVMAGVDAVIARGYVDPQRLGILGGSYGGFMTSWTIGHTNRFAAAITDRSYLDARSFFGTSDIGPWLSRENWGRPWWEDPERYRWHSPLTYVANIQTPLLIIHSDEDYRCPIEQAEQLFTALVYQGREVEMLRFEKQNHDLSRNGHPRLRVERLEAIVDWFARYLPTADHPASNLMANDERNHVTIGAPSPVE